MIETFVSSKSTCTHMCRTVVFFVAGILTYRNNFEAAAGEFAKRYPHIKIVMIFPYGMADGTNRSSLSRLLARQIAPVGYDLFHEESRRVKAAVEIIREHGAAADQLILVGHSAGSVIAYRAGLNLEEKHGFREVQVFAVGSPKFFLKDISFNKQFTYITGQKQDKITRIGRWRKPGSRKFRGKPGREIQLNFNPDHQGWKFHASYFLNSAWSDANQVFHSNVEDLVSKIHELCPDK